MKSFAAMHNDWLDPDIHLWEEEPTCLHPKCDGFCDPDGDQYVCDECGTIYDVDDDGELQFADDSARDDIVTALSLEIWRLQSHRPKETSTLEQFIRHMPEGDFEWRDVEAGDWHVYCCHEKDCHRQWHKVAYTIECGRTDGKFWVESRSVDEDGDWDFDAAYDEREGDTPDMFPEFYEWYMDHLWDYFHGWAQYWLMVYETGNDVCEEIWNSKGESVRKIALKSVGENLKYMYGMIEKK